MADIKGFLKYDRETPTRRPVPVRLRDWKEVYEDFPDDLFHRNLNTEMVDLDPLDETDAEWLRDTIRTHLAETNSAVAQRIHDRWHTNVRHFKKVMPEDYKRVLEAAEKARIEGVDVDEAIMASAALEKE